jgi:polyhydroxybutyrate depolymerase
MRGRFLSISGLVVGLTLTIGSGAFAQTPATAGAAGARTGQPQRPARPQSPTFARIQARTYDFKEAGKPIPYEVYVPTRYDASKPTPLIIALHGLGSNPTQLIRYQGLTDLAEDRGYIVAAPMGYNTGGWYGSQGAGAPRVGRGNETDVPANLGELSELDVMNVLGMMQKEFNIDPARTYLFGHSMGGGGTWHLGMKNPGIWAALALAAPAIYSSPDELIAITTTPVIVIQGDNDRLVDVAVTRRWVEKMKALGMTYQYVEVPGGSHTDIITANPENMKKIFDFFDKARRK